MTAQNFGWLQHIGNASAGFFHHAFLVEGRREETLPVLRGFVAEEFGIEVSGNPDFLEMEFVSFGVDDGRALKEMQSLRSSTENAKKIFVVSANSFTEQAQNALLKIFEEPSKDTIFFVLSPSAQFFLPTLLSRVVCISASDGPASSESSGVATEANPPSLVSYGEARKFVKMNYTDRLAFVAAILKEMKDPATTQSSGVAKDEKDPQRAQRLMEDLIKYFYSQKRTPENVRVLELTMKYREYAHNNAPSYKQMLEHLALVVPADTKYA